MSVLDIFLDRLRKKKTPPVEAEEPSKKRPPNIAHFQDESGVSTNQLNIGLWFLKERSHFIIAVVVIFSIISLISWGYVIYYLADYILVGQMQDQQLRQELTAVGALPHDGRGIRSYLTVGDTQVVTRPDNTIDLVAEMRNANSRSVITFNYYFDVAGQRVGQGREFILPADSKYVLALNQTVSSPVAAASLVIEDISAHRLDPKFVVDWQQFQEDRLNFVVTEAKFTPGQISGLSEKVSVGEASFTITNAGGYSYKEARLVVLLKSGSRVVGATYYYLPNFRSGEKRAIRFSWPGVASGVNEVEVKPDINLLDENVYLRYSS